MTRRIAVVDYGVGNLFSVSRAIEAGGGEAVVTSDPDELLAAERLVLPGVGAFGDGMAALEERGLERAVRAFADSGRPLLGICLGMQMLLDESEEFGRHRGLGLIPGRVVPVPATGADGAPHTIPHIGWNALVPGTAGRTWDGSLLDGIAAGASVYFVHSFMAVPENETDGLADCLYDGRRIAAAINRGNVTGCQFHPEKSADTGLRIIRNFVQ